MAVVAQATEQLLRLATHALEEGCRVVIRKLRPGGDQGTHHQHATIGDDAELQYLAERHLVQALVGRVVSLRGVL